MLAILTTHPIQYQTPIWRALAADGRVPFTVYFMSEQGLKALRDEGFGRDLAWDIDLLGGYPSEFLRVVTGARQDSFGWLRLAPGFGRTLSARGVRVLWVQGWQVAAYWQALREARRAGIEVWLRGETNLRSNAGRLPRWLKWPLLRRFLDRVDRFLTVGVANRLFYRRLGYGEDRMVAAPYCVENPRFSSHAEAKGPERSRVRAAWRIADDAFCIVFVGKFIAKKNPLDLVEAVRRLQQLCPDRRFHLLWAGSGELGAEIRARSKVVYDADAPSRANEGTANAPDAPASSFVGFLNQSQVPEVYVAADVLVLPSNATETWGLVVNEAMATGLPCVVSDACGCAEDLVLPLRPDLVYPLGDIDALVRSLAAVVANPPSARLLRDHIAQYDPARTVESVVSLYRARFGPE